MGLAEFEVVADSLWNSAESRFYKKGQIVMLPSGTKTGAESAVRPVNAPDDAEKTEKRRGRSTKSE